MAESFLITSYAPILATAVLGLVIVWVTLSIPKLLAPSHKTPSKLETYESGEVPIGAARGPIDVQYYLYALLFIVIDVEAAFMIPFALNYISLTGFQLAAAGLFVLLVLDGWVYAWKKGALTWQS